MSRQKFFIPPSSKVWGIKIGMLSDFVDGFEVAVTVVYVPHRYVSEVRERSDGTIEYVVMMGLSKIQRLSQPVLGKVAKLYDVPLEELRDLQISVMGDPARVPDNLKVVKALSKERCVRALKGIDKVWCVGDSMAIVFSEGQMVDAQGISRGKGFAGGVKRYGFSTNNRSSVSRAHRTRGSSGIEGVGKVFKNTRMPGRMGGKVRSVQNLVLRKIEEYEGGKVLHIIGSIPGPRRGWVRIQTAVKTLRGQDV